MLKPNLLKNSLSANLLKNFRWLIFRFRLNNPFYFVQGALFVFALFNLQGTVSLSLSGLACLFYHKLFGLSSPFFKFFDFLPQVSMLSALSCFQSSTFHLFRSRAPKRLHIIHPRPRFVNPLFHVFSKKCSRRLSTPTAVCYRFKNPRPQVSSAT